MKKAVKITNLTNLELCPNSKDTGWFEESLDPRLDIFIKNSSALRSNFQTKNLTGNDLTEEFQENSNSIFNSDQFDELPFDSTGFIRATNSFELSIEICGFVKFLSVIAPDVFGGKTCDGFLEEISRNHRRKRKRGHRSSTKSFGSSTSNSTVNRYPWLCSLKG